jgi:hypothetical protein
MHSTREAWLHAAVAAIRPWFQEHDYVVPEKLQLSFSLPKGNVKMIRGQCWDPICSDDGTWNIMISPLQDDPFQVISTLVHELAHAVVGSEAGHKKPFVECGKALGLEGKPKSMALPREGEPAERVAQLLEVLGPLPHSPLIIRGKNAKVRPPAGGWVKLVSVNDPDYILRISPVAYRNGPPVDPWGKLMVEEDDPSLFRVGGEDEPEEE